MFRGCVPFFCVFPDTGKKGMKENILQSVTLALCLNLTMQRYDYFLNYANISGVIFV